MRADVLSSSYYFPPRFRAALLAQLGLLPGSRAQRVLEVSDRAIIKLAEAGFDPIFGARPLKRAIQQAIENPISRLILEGKFGPNDVIPVDVDGNEFIFTRQVH